MEAALKMKEVDDCSMDDETKPRDREEFRSESIATLRAKAQEHSAKVLTALHKTRGGCDKSHDSNTSPSLTSDSNVSLLNKSVGQCF